MKQGIHPTNYRPVVFQDTSDGSTFLTRSTAESEETIKWEDGNEYPLIKVHISSSSHPFYTGKEKLVDIEGRVDRFKAKAERAKKLQQERKSQKSTDAKPKAENIESGKPETIKIGEKKSAKKNKKSQK